MNVLVVGGGGREHAIIKKLKESKSLGEIYCAPGNGGIAKDAKCVDIAATNVSAMVEFAQRNAIGYVVVAPDDPLVMGMVDALQLVGIPAFGPSKAAAQIEGSKIFAKDLMKRYGIPTGEYQAFDLIDDARRYLDARNGYPVVIKADGLALGKGVIIAQNRAQALEALDLMMQQKTFGESGAKVVIEEFLTGPEVSVLAFTDGHTVVPMVSSMDHKRALDGDRGPNTGGMGTIAPNPFYTKEIADVCMKTIFEPTVKAMRLEGATFRGCLYFGLMLTPDGPKVIEYNCRFGDPEAQVVLPLLKGDLLEIMRSTNTGTLARQSIEWADAAAACVILASGGYPGKYPTALPIKGLDDDGQLPGKTVYHAGTRLDESGTFITAGGRVMGVSATAPTLPLALSGAYAGVEAVQFEGVHFRRDIGKSGTPSEV
jgi:phosphoribosylamine--glycine ligase